jgi:hypothetical protein
MAPSDLSERIRSEVEQGRPREEIVAGLLERGLSQASAERFVDRAIAARDAAPSGPPSAPPGRAHSAAADTDDDTDDTDAGPTPFPWKGLVVGLVAVVALVGFIQWQKGRGRTVVGEAAATVQEARSPEGEARPKALLPAPRVSDDARFGGDAPRLNSLLMLLRNPDTSWSGVCEAALELGRSGVREAIPDLRGFLADSARSSLQGCAATALIALGEVDEPLAFYVASVQSSDDARKSIGIAGFGQIGPRAAAAALPHLEAALHSPDASHRYLAVESLSKIGPEGVPLLRSALGDSEAFVKDRAAAALAQIDKR